MIRIIPLLAVVLLGSNLFAAEEEKKLEPAHIKKFSETLGVKGEVKGKVYTVSIPRGDLDVRNLVQGDIPVEAGLSTRLYLWRCPCGKYFIVGDFCVVDYESNDVLDALRKSFFEVASVSPMFLQDRPRIMSIRFQGEGDIDKVAGTIKEALKWMGEERTKPTNPVK